MELSIPVSAELRASTELAALLAGGLLTVCLITYLALTASLKAAVVRPLQRLALAADAASLDLEEPVDLPRSGTSELRQLSDALVRLNTSLRKALRELSSKSAKQGVRKS